MVGFVNSEFGRGFGDHQLPAVAGRGQAVRSDSVESLFGYAHYSIDPAIPIWGKKILIFFRSNPEGS